MSTTRKLIRVVSLLRLMRILTTGSGSKKKRRRKKRRTRKQKGGYTMNDFAHFVNAPGEENLKDIWIKMDGGNI